MSAMVMTLKFSADEPFFKGHYPNFPVTPGVMLIDRAVAAAKNELESDIVKQAMKKAVPTYHDPEEVNRDADKTDEMKLAGAAQS